MTTTQVLLTPSKRTHLRHVANKLRGRTKYMLIIFCLLHFTAPISETSTATGLLYFLIYVFLMAIGVYVASTDRSRLIFTIAVTSLLLIVGMVWVLSPSQPAFLSIITFILFAVFIGTITFILGEFVVLSERVTRDVLFAALALYLLLGNLYTVLFSLLQIITVATTGEPAFVLSGDPTADVPWQRLYYFSYTTLTTLGYGDILPVSSFAQSLATSETIIGVLYTSVMIARLVGLYQAEAGDASRGEAAKVQN